MRFDKFPLKERIGNAALYVERQDLCAQFDLWVNRIPRELSKSMALLARKKSGKSAFMQRLFNRTWQQNKEVVPFYLEIPDQRIWYPQLALMYYQAFASQYISFLERDPELTHQILELDEIRSYGEAKGIRSFVRDVDALQKNFDQGSHDLMWKTAYSAPHRFASSYGRPIAVLIDEFQHLSGFICTDQDKQKVDPTIPGAFHEHSESKVAPMLVTGSAVGWLVNVIDTYLEAGRLTKRRFSPYLAPEEGLTAVYRYAEVYEEPITNETAVLINQLTGSDPYFIACIFRDVIPAKDLLTRHGVQRAVQFETTDPDAEMAAGWILYFNRVLETVNQRYAKLILLHLSRYPEKALSPLQVRERLKLDLSVEEVHDRLEKLYSADLIQRNFEGFSYQGLADGTFYLVVQERLAEEMKSIGTRMETLNYRHEQLLKTNKSLQGALNSAMGHVAELQLMCDLQMRKKFPLSTYFEGIADEELFELATVHSRHYVQTSMGHRHEVDIRADDSGNRTLLIEVKKRAQKTGVAEIKVFLEAVTLFCEQHPTRQAVMGFLSLGGFSKDASALCRKHGIGTATTLNHYQTEWSPL